MRVNVKSVEALKTENVRILFCGMLGILSGCGEGSPPPVDEPEAYPFVQVQVKLDGKLVDNAFVTLHGAGDKSRRIVGAFDSDCDCYRFVTTEGKDKKAGVPEGEYSVAIRPGQATHVKVPSKYTKPDTSGLTVSIHDGENMLEPLELTP